MAKLLINYSKIKSKESLNFHHSDKIFLKNHINSSNSLNNPNNPNNPNPSKTLQIEINTFKLKIFQSDSIFNYKILYCLGIPSSINFDNIQPLISPYYDSISMIRYITEKKNNNQNIILKEEKIENEKKSFIIYFKSGSICRNFYREMHNLEMNNKGERLYFLKCENVVFYENFKDCKNFLNFNFEIPSCLVCLLKIDNDSTKLKIKGMLNIGC